MKKLAIVVTSMLIGAVAFVIGVFQALPTFNYGERILPNASDYGGDWNVTCDNNNDARYIWSTEVEVGGTILYVTSDFNLLEQMVGNVPAYKIRANPRATSGYSLAQFFQIEQDGTIDYKTAWRNSAYIDFYPEGLSGFDRDFKETHDVLINEYPNLRNLYLDMVEDGKCRVKPFVSPWPEFKTDNW